MITGGIPIAQKTIATLISAAQTGQLTQGTSSTVMTGAGIFAGNSTTVDNTHSRGVDATGRYFESVTSAISSNNAGNSCADAAFRMDQPCVCCLTVSVTDNTSIRCFAGLITAIGVNFANCCDADTLGAQGIGFQFSASRGDTNWQFVSYNGTTQTTTNTTVACTSNTVYQFQIVINSSSSVTWSIYNAAGLLLASATTTATLPSSSTTFIPVFAGETQTSATRGFRVYSFGGAGFGYTRQ